MKEILFWVFTVIFCYSALIVATHREARWGVFAWWLNSMATAALLIGVGSGHLGPVLLISATICAIVQFLIADVVSEPAPSLVFEGIKKRASWVFPIVVSGALGAALTYLFKKTTQDQLSFVGASPRGKSFFSEEGFIGTQVIVLLSLAAIIGVALLNREKAEPGESKND